MDILNIKAQPRVIEIKHPEAGEAIGLRITVLPESDEKVRRVQRRNLDRQLKDRKSNLTAARIEENTLEVVIASVSDWEWYGEANFRGEQPECTEEKVRELFTAAPWIRDQVREEFDDSAAFFAN